jgi:hypothetical protein
MSDPPTCDHVPNEKDILSLLRLHAFCHIRDHHIWQNRTPFSPCRICPTLLCIVLPLLSYHNRMQCTCQKLELRRKSLRLHKSPLRRKTVIWVDFL